MLFIYSYRTAIVSFALSLHFHFPRIYLILYIWTWRTAPTYTNNTQTILCIHNSSRHAISLPSPQSPQLSIRMHTAVAFGVKSVRALYYLHIHAIKTSFANYTVIQGERYSIFELISTITFQLIDCAWDCSVIFSQFTWVFTGVLLHDDDHTGYVAKKSLRLGFCTGGGQAFNQLWAVFIATYRSTYMAECGTIEWWMMMKFQKTPTLNYAYIAIFICPVERKFMCGAASEVYVTCAHLLSQTQPYGSRNVPKKVNRSINHCPVITKWSIIDHCVPLLRNPNTSARDAKSQILDTCEKAYSITQDICKETFDVHWILVDRMRYSNV